MTGLEAEWMSFVQAFFSGMTVYWGYFCVRKFRRIFAHNLIAISIEDALFWMVTSIYLFVQIYYTSDGSIRWYFVLGVVLGVLIIGFFQKRIGKSAEKNKNRKIY